MTRAEAAAVAHELLSGLSVDGDCGQGATVGLYERLLGDTHPGEVVFTPADVAAFVEALRRFAGILAER